MTLRPLPYVQPNTVPRLRYTRARSPAASVVAPAGPHRARGDGAPADELVEDAGAPLDEPADVDDRPESAADDPQAARISASTRNPQRTVSTVTFAAR
jgi:hypothetical protein